MWEEQKEDCHQQITHKPNKSLPKLQRTGLVCSIEHFSWIQPWQVAAGGGSSWLCRRVKHKPLFVQTLQFSCYADFSIKRKFHLCGSKWRAKKFLKVNTLAHCTLSHQNTKLLLTESGKKTHILYITCIYYNII